MIPKASDGQGDARPELNSVTAAIQKGFVRVPDNRNANNHIRFTI